MGTVDNCVHEVGEAVEEPVNALKEQLPQQDKLNIDETGWKKAGKRRWLWTFVALNFTFFQIAQSRGKKVLEEILGQFFPGIITADRLRSYRSYQMAGWQICLAHLIREAKGLSQSDDPATSRFGYWIRRELKLASLWKKGKAKSLEMNACKARLRRACLLNQDREDKHVRNLARAILKDWEAVTLFTRVEDISPTNNVAEQSLRSLVIARKICFGNHSEKGLVTTARLIVATARMRGVDVWDYLAHALVHYRSGQPVPLLDLSSG
ncbi:transposase [Dehalococcoidia bacterium]|nr:transposase [Dehalococcoidia bacterium]